MSKNEVVFVFAKPIVAAFGLGSVAADYCVAHVRCITVIVSKKQVTIEREEVDDEPITAIPIMISDQLLLIHYLYDFFMDGYKVLCISDITKIRREEIEECCSIRQ